MSDPLALPGQDKADRSVPSNLEAEMALLGALMIDNDVFDVTVDHITAKDFFEPVHQRIYAAVQDTIARGKIATPVTLKPMFENDEAIHMLGGPRYLAQLTADGQGLLAARDLARQIAELSQLRQLLIGIRDVHEQLVTNHAANPAGLAAQLEAVAFESTASKNDRTAIFSGGDSIRRVIARVEHIQETGEATGAVAPDIPEIEEVIGPFEPNHMIVVAGRPGMGKSAFMCSAARSMAEAGYGQGIISLEMGAIDLGQRFAADVALALQEPIYHARIRDAKLSAGDLQVLNQAALHIDRLPLKMVDTAGMTMARIAMTGRRMKREFEAEGRKLDVLWLDYLQLILPDRRTDNRVGDITEISNSVKRLAKELNCTVVALSQLSRAVEQRENKVPQMSDLRESGAIEQDADTICFLYREEYYLAAREPDRSEKPREWEAWNDAMHMCRDQLDLHVPKRRGGATGKRTVTYLRQLQAIRQRDFVVKGGLL